MVLLRLLRTIVQIICFKNLCLIVTQQNASIAMLPQSEFIIYDGFSLNV